MATSPNLYALLVGVDQYERVRPLRGCVNDIRKVNAYLKADPDFTDDARAVNVLTDKAATKQAIIDGFRTHLSQATATDTVLFYFSGHGTQEQADAKLWPNEADGRLECIVCFDGPVAPVPDFLMTDKEIRYLIHELTQKTGAHVITIFDCCHSGDNTRNFDLLMAARGGDEVLERRVANAFPKRAWSEFLFSDTITEDTLRQQGPEKLIPEGTHIQFSACESDESALEINGEGVFTKTLLTVLKAAGGPLSYRTLHSRVREAMRFGFEQQPRLYVPESGDGSAEGMLRLGFLNKPISDASSSAELAYNKHAKKWTLNVGAIHGLGQTSGSVTVAGANGGPDALLTVQHIGPDYTHVELDAVTATRFDRAKTYRATVAGLLTRPLGIHLRNDNGQLTDVQTVSDYLAEKAGRYVVPQGGETGADYTLHARNGLYYLTRPNDEFRPLAQPVPAGDPRAARFVADDLQHIAQWQHIRHLTNPVAPTSPVQVSVARRIGAGTESLPVANEVVTVLLNEQDGRWLTDLEIQLTNPTGQKLYVNAFYLSRSFRAYPEYLPKNYLLDGELTKQVMLGRPDKDVPSGRKDSIRFGLDEVVRQYNWPELTEHFKFIITKEPLSETALAFLTLNGLTPPPTLTKSGAGFKTRDGDDFDQPAAQPLPDWSTLTLTIVTPNPLHNQVQADELSAMIGQVDEIEETDLTKDTTAIQSAQADFALGLYYTLGPDETGAPTFRPRSEITLLGDPAGLAERGWLGDAKLWVANTIARKLRNRQYFQTIKQHPSRPRLVAEGDSWFQYPLLVRELIDHLSGVYPIYCVSAAGDTLRNMGQKPNFLDAIEEQNPAIFLMSAGGNDILGEQFRDFLETTFNQQPAPLRYLKNNLIQELDQLQTIYQSIFQTLEQRFPQLPVIIHGYDYIIPVDTTLQPKKESWLGKYMIERGIEPQSERETVIQFILDEFNKRQQEAAAQFNNVFYIDLRGTIKRTNRVDECWHDEIHPNDKGYQLLAAPFIQQINQILTSVSAHPAPAAGRDFVLEMTDDSQGREMMMAEPGDNERDLLDVFEHAAPESSPPFSMSENEPPAPLAPSPPPPSPFRPGNLDYDLPELMPVGIPTICTVRIAGAEVAANTFKINANSTLAGVRVTDEMSVELTDGSAGANFGIQPLGPVRQAVIADEFTEWRFSMTPRQHGRFPLTLTVTAHFNGKSKVMLGLDKLISASGLSPEPLVPGFMSMPTAAPVGKRKILFLSANPALDRLRLDTESRRIWEELEMSDERDKYDYTTVSAVTPHHLTRILLKEKPYILHFSGHGTSEGLYLVDDTEAPVLASTEALQQLFSVLGAGIGCLVLNACYSVSQAKELARFIPQVVGTSSKVGDDAALDFSVGFYQAIGAGQGFPNAFTLGRALVRLDGGLSSDDVFVLLPK
ncbi:caspase family protein [Spirosoma arcticum]